MSNFSLPTHAICMPFLPSLYCSQIASSSKARGSPLCLLVLPAPCLPTPEGEGHTSARAVVFTDGVGV